MNKINYPSKTSEFKALKKEYQSCILNSSKIDLTEIQNFLTSIGVKESFENILVLPLDELIQITPLSATNVFLGLTDTKIKDRKRNIASYFKYVQFQQRELSIFFNSYSDTLNILGCSYCGIDHINPYIPLSNDYRDFEHFMSECTKEDLLKIRNIGNERAKKILNIYKGNILKYSEIHNGSDKFINNILQKLTNTSGELKFDVFKNEKKNHFTLDHILPQSEYPHLSLSLFNLVPSCYSCNSKLKRDKKIYSNLNELVFTSPTGSEKMQDIIFKIYFKTGFDEKKLPKELNDYSVKIESPFPEYFKIFNLQGRYNFHKKVSQKLISQRRIYSDSQIDEILKLFKKGGINILEGELKKQIFGYEIFAENSNIPFQKYKKDIARQLKLIR